MEDLCNCFVFNIKTKNNEIVFLVVSIVILDPLFNS